MTAKGVAEPSRTAAPARLDHADIAAAEEHAAHAVAPAVVVVQDVELDRGEARLHHVLAGRPVTRVGRVLEVGIEFQTRTRLLKRSVT